MKPYEVDFTESYHGFYVRVAFADKDVRDNFHDGALSTIIDKKRDYDPRKMESKAGFFVEISRPTGEYNYDRGCMFVWKISNFLSYHYGDEDITALIINKIDHGKFHESKRVNKNPKSTRSRGDGVLANARAEQDNANV